jgi:hypothetical protein
LVFQNFCRKISLGSFTLSGSISLVGQHVQDEEEKGDGEKRGRKEKRWEEEGSGTIGVRDWMTKKGEEEKKRGKERLDWVGERVCMRWGERERKKRKKKRKGKGKERRDTWHKLSDWEETMKPSLANREMPPGRGRFPFYLKPQLI